MKRDEGTKLIIIINQAYFKVDSPKYITKYLSI